MPTYSAITITADGDRAKALGEALEALGDTPIGVGVFELEDGSTDWEVGAYFEERPDTVALDLLAAAHGARAFTVSEVPDIDWVAHVRRDLAPVEAGRFFLYGSHDAGKVPAGVVPLLIEASMAFGTGHHGTTKGCLIAFDKLLTDGFRPSRIADIGCGTAVLAMAAAKTLPDAEIIAGDFDAVAVEVAEANLIANGLDGRISCVEAAGFDHVSMNATLSFELIFANILKGPLIDLAPEIAKRLISGGIAILSGLLNEQAAEITEIYGKNGMRLVDSFVLGDWSTLVLRKDWPDSA